MFLWGFSGSVPKSEREKRKGWATPSTVAAMTGEACGEVMQLNGGNFEGFRVRVLRWG